MLHLISIFMYDNEAHGSHYLQEKQFLAVVNKVNTAMIFGQKKIYNHRSLSPLWEWNSPKFQPGAHKPP